MIYIVAFLGLSNIALSLLVMRLWARADQAERVAYLIQMGLQ